MLRRNRVIRSESLKAWFLIPSPAAMAVFSSVWISLLASVRGFPYRTGMVFLPKPDVILTHESDLDGLVAGVLLQRFQGKKNLD